MGLMDIRRNIILNEPHLETVSGLPVVFYTDLSAPLKVCDVYFLPTQEGVGDPSPDNVRAITGRTGINLSVGDSVLPISWQPEVGTVYGGNVDLIKGLLTVDKEQRQVTYQWLSGLSSSYIGVIASASAMGGERCVWIRNWNYARIRARKSGGVWSVCNAYKVKVHDTNVSSSQNRIVFAVADGTTVNDFKATVQNLEANGDGLWICYEMANPVQYQLTPQQIQTFKGHNNIWSDANGEIDVRYWTH